MVLSAMWITNEPSYEPIIVFITSLIGWVGSEYNEHRNKIGGESEHDSNKGAVTIPEKKASDIDGVDQLNKEEFDTLYSFMEQTESGVKSVSNKIDLPEQIVRHHIQTLCKNGYINQTRADTMKTRPALYKITHKGSSYFMDKRR